jgi:hypothetical protein
MQVQCTHRWWTELLVALICNKDVKMIFILKIHYHTEKSENVNILTERHGQVMWWQFKLCMLNIDWLFDLGFRNLTCSWSSWSKSTSSSSISKLGSAPVKVKIYK